MGTGTGRHRGRARRLQPRGSARPPRWCRKRRLGGATGPPPASSPTVRATGRVRRPKSCRASSPYPLTCPPVTGAVQNGNGAVDAHHDEIRIPSQQVLPDRGQPDLLVTTGARSELRTFRRDSAVGYALDNQTIRQVDGSGVPRSLRTPGGHQDGHDQELAQPLKSSCGLRKISIVSRRYSRNGGPVRRGGRPRWSRRFRPDRGGSGRFRWRARWGDMSSARHPGLAVDARGAACHR